MYVLLLPAASVPVLGERLPLRIYTSADGLGSSATFDLVRDAKGFIWLCSRDGLVRFDGYRFITYRIGDESADPAVFALRATRSGPYWINLNRGSDYRFIPKPDDEEVAPLPQSASNSDLRVPIEAEPLPAGVPFPTFEDAEGNLWTANNTGFFLMTETSPGHFDLQRHELPFPGNPKKEFTSIVFEKSTGPGFWVGTNWGMSRRLPDGRTFHVTVAPKDGADPITVFAEDKDSHVWLARSDGIIVMKAPAPSQLFQADHLSDRKANVSQGTVGRDGAAALPRATDDAVFFTYQDIFRGITPERLNSPDFLKPLVNRIVSSSDGTVWIATNHGLVAYSAGRFRHYTTANGLAADNVSSMVEDSDGYLWLATYGGLHRLNPRGMTSFGQGDGLESEPIHSIYENSQGELEVVIGNFKVAALRDGVFKMVRPRLPADAIFGWMSNVALHGRNGDWWFLTATNLLRYSGIGRIEELDGKRETEDIKLRSGDALPSNFKVLEDRAGNIWVSNFIPGLGWTVTKRGVDGNVTHFPASQIFEGASGLVALADDGQGGTWLAFNGHGLARYRDGVFTKIDAEGAPLGGLTGMHRDLAGRIWITTGREGLFRIDNPAADVPQFVRYTVEDGLTSNNTRCAVDDLDGNIYVGTVRGVNKLDIRSGKFTYFGTADGLASDFVNTAFRDHSGTLWFGTMNGLSKFVPHSEPAVEISDVLVSGLKVAGEGYSVSPVGQRSVVVADLAPRQNNVQIDFLSARTGGASDAKYQYRLEGIDTDWGPPTFQASVTFANLLPGSYRFLVRVAGVDSSTPAVVSFTILRPFWQRWWFLLAIAFSAAAVMYLVYRYRLSQLLKLERVRTRIASDLHDDIGSSLSQIAILSEVVQRRVGENGVSEPLEKIADTSREMVDSMSDIVWAINPARDRLGDLLKRMRRFATDLLEAVDIEIKFRIPKKLPNVHLDADLRRDLYLVFKEAINNVARHSAATLTEVDLSLSGSILKLIIADDGRGFDVNDKPESSTLGGNGLINMRRRIERLDGEIVFESAAERGTRVKISVPLAPNNLTSRVRKIISTQRGNN